MTPLLWSDLKSEWGVRVLMCDASFQGRGVLEARVPVALTCVVCPFNDRWRWGRSEDPLKLRRDASSQLSFEHEQASAPPSTDTPDVPKELLDRDWNVVSADPWARVETIPMLEGRAVAWAVNHVCRSVDNH
eukprot:7165481-Heterocapsa_arctica.AAC.1